MKNHSRSHVNRAEDPQLIPGISNYCHRWCERCAFTDRCLVFREVREYDVQHPESGPLEHVHDSFQNAFGLLEAWCEREGIDFEKIREEANSEESAAERRRADEAIDADPLYRLARTYGQGAFEIVRSLENAGRLRAWPADVRAAIETIGWYAFFAAGKIHRGLHGLAERPLDGIEWDAVQNDWNGSVKAARFAIAESRRAWAVVLEAGEATSRSPLRQMIELLDRIDRQAADRFPLAMQFVRPGFDEPDVAAGALTSLNSFDPR